MGEDVPFHQWVVRKSEGVSPRTDVSADVCVAFPSSSSLDNFRAGLTPTDADRGTNFLCICLSKCTRPRTRSIERPEIRAGTRLQAQTAGFSGTSFPAGTAGWTESGGRARTRGQTAMRGIAGTGGRQTPELEYEWHAEQQVWDVDEQFAED